MQVLLLPTSLTHHIQHCPYMPYQTIPKCKSNNEHANRWDTIRNGLKT